MTDLIQTENINYARDLDSRALLNINAMSLAGYRRKRARDKTMGNEINSLKDEIKELREMISALSKGN